jgi:pimeloyl-ACP methyl ester carboxylesterase
MNVRWDRLWRSAGIQFILFLTLSAQAQTAKEVKGATPLVAVPNEAPAKLIVDPPIPEQLALGRVFIQYRTENLRILPVFGSGALAVSPRLGHLHYYVDDQSWPTVDTSGETVVLVGLKPGPHKVRLELADTTHKPIPDASSLVEFTVPNLKGSQGEKDMMTQFSASQAAMGFRTTTIDGVDVFYREAGDPSKPTIVLLHGFPSSSYTFHDLIPRLADRFHVIAPDYPGMGYSDAPAPTVLRPTFDDVARVIDAFIAQRAPGPVILYMHDIGSPIGMRIATAHAERIAGLIFQNTTISQEGWNPAVLSFYERISGPETPDKLAEAEKRFTVDRSMFLHQTGARQPDALNRDNWAIDAYAFSIPADRLFMSRLLMNLAANVQHYPEWNAYLKSRQPKTLIVWGRNDPLFVPAAAELVKQNVPTAEVRYFDGGHFVLDENADAIAKAIIETFSGKTPMTLKAGEVLFIPVGTIHAARNVGNTSGTELGTYVVEKGKPLVKVVK